MTPCVRAVEASSSICKTLPGLGDGKEGDVNKNKAREIEKYGDATHESRWIRMSMKDEFLPDKLRSRPPDEQEDTLRDE